jgi:hypothetical protein
MNMFLYTSMYSIQIHVYYLIFHNELFLTKILISFKYVIYFITMN